MLILIATALGLFFIMVAFVSHLLVIILAFATVTFWAYVSYIQGSRKLAKQAVPEDGAIDEGAVELAAAMSKMSTSTLDLLDICDDYGMPEWKHLVYVRSTLLLSAMATGIGTIVGIFALIGLATGMITFIG